MDCVALSHERLFGNFNKSQELDNDLDSINKLQYFKIEYVSFFLISLICVRVTQKKLQKRKWIDTLPGPTQLPFFGGLLYFSDLTKTFQLLINWCEKYGPIFRSDGIFNEPYVFVTEPEHVQAILSSNQLGTVSKPRIPYDSIFGQFLKNGLLISEGEYWKNHRKTLGRAFTYKSFFGYFKTFNQYSKSLVNDLEKLFSQNKEPQEISNLIHCCSLQIICVSVMGLDVCDSKEGKIFNDKFQRYKIISAEKAMYFWYLIDFLWKLQPISREYTEIINVLNCITRKTIDNRCNNNVTAGIPGDCDIGSKPRRSMIDEMIAAKMTPEEILVEANTVIAAGFESTSLTIHYMLFMLALNPEHQVACQQEIDEVFGDPVLCPDGNITAEGLSELKYLERCTYETLRLFPVIFVFQRKPEVPINLDEGNEIPAGTNVVIPVYAIHRNPKYFPEPEHFNPDRFLPENSKLRHPYAYIPFSGGMRNCIGYKFAILEIKTVVAHILRNFHVSTVDKMDHVPILPSIVMTPTRDYKFVLTRRSQSSS